MTYAGLSCICFRLIGVLLCTFAVIQAAYIATTMPTYMGGFLSLLLGMGLVPGVLLIVFSKPLGRIIASGVE